MAIKVSEKGFYNGRMIGVLNFLVDDMVEKFAGNLVDISTGIFGVTVSCSVIGLMV